MSGFVTMVYGTARRVAKHATTKYQNSFVQSLALVLPDQPNSGSVENFLIPFQFGLV